MAASCRICFSRRRNFRGPGQSVIGKFRTAPGGKGFNQAVAAARAGAETGFIGALGGDAFGSGARAFLAAEGIAFHGVEKAGEASGTAVVVVDASGQNQIVVALGANQALQPEEIPGAWLTGAEVVVGQLEIFLPAAQEALRVARAAGAVTILNPAPMRSDFDRAILAQVEILIPNETEFAALVNLLPAFDRTDFREDELTLLPVEDLHALCRRLGPSIILVTLGARGCFLSLPDRAVAIPGVENVVAVDTTGAGRRLCRRLCRRLPGISRRPRARRAPRQRRRRNFRHPTRRRTLRRPPPRDRRRPVASMTDY